MNEIIKKTEAELVKMLAEKREAVRRFRFGSSGGKTRNVKEGGNLRREVARILTELNRRAREVVR